MLFIVPDTEETASPEDANKAASFKVELDLDDAPFLEEPLDEKKEEKPSEQEAAPAPAEEAAPEEAPKKESLLDRLKANKKKLIIAGGAALILIIAAILVNMFLFSEPKKEAPPPPPPPQEQGPKRVTITTEPPPAAPEEPVYLVTWEPFLIALKGSEGEIRFLTCQFSTPTKDQMLQAEMIAKKIVLRDAIYYYLKNKPLTFLSDKTKQQSLKEDLISVINEHVSSAKLTDLYFEEYVVRGS